MLHLAQSAIERIAQQVNRVGQYVPQELNIRNVLLFCVLSLLCLGSVMVVSASMPYAEYMYDQPMYYATRHLVYMVAGLVAAIVAYNIRLERWFENTVILWLGTALLLLLVLLIGNDVNGSKRWLSFPGFTVQPSEIAKFAMAVFTADYVVRRADEVRQNYKGFLRLGGPILSMVILIMAEPDLGATAVIVCTMIGIFFLAGAPLVYFAIVAGMVVAGIGFLIAVEPYRLQRLMSFSNPWEDPLGTGYQLSQSLMAFGRGEWFGTGLGHSIQKLSYLPEAHTDFMLAVLAEELGFAGICTVFALSFLMLFCCMRIGHRALKNMHLRAGYLAYAIAIIFFLQICVNAGMNMGLLPTKGLTLPFISYGGTSLLVCAFMIGVMFKIERDTRDVYQEPKRTV